LTPVDVAAAYSMLAREGWTADVHTVKEEVPERMKEPPNQVISAGAAWLTSRALRKRDRPDFPVRRRATNLPTGLHWKTGTSARNRDAWSAGFGPSYAAAVWLGNFDNERSAGLIGSEAAGPLYFDVLEAIEPAPDSVQTKPPEGLTKVEVCALSGHRPMEACPNRDEAWMVSSNVATERCPYHVQRDVNPKTGLAVPPGCEAELKTETASFVQVPSGAARWMGDRFGKISQPPQLHPACGGGSAASVASAPTITWPPVRHEVVMLEMLPRSDQQIPLEAETAAGGAMLHWYVDGAFIASKPADQKVWWKPSAGNHEIVVMDAAGRSDSRNVHVRWRGESSGRVNQ
jgi:penicillin-binding protein 1C